MKFHAPLRSGTLIKRYKRFLADIDFGDGEPITAHVANSGAMLGLTSPCSRVWCTPAADPARKLRWTWEMVELDLFGERVKVGVNTSHPNKIVEEAILSGAIPVLSGYASLRREVKYGANSRIDILLEDSSRPTCYVEVKNVHLFREKGLAEFPDSVTSRGAKHLEEMGNMVEQGARAVMVYCIQGPAERFSLAADIDPAYRKAFDRAMQRGVEAIALTCTMDESGITPSRLIPLDIK